MTPTIELESELLPSDADFERMRDEMFARLDEPVHLAPRRPRRARRVLRISIPVAAALAAVLVIANVVAPQGATAEAAEVLHKAAVASINSSDPVVGQGQYLKVELNESALLFGDHGAVVDPQRIILYVPADRSENWVQSRQELPPGKQYGDARSLVKDLQNLKPADGHTPGQPVLHQAEGGRFVSYPLPFAELAALPDTPAALHDYLYSHATGDLSKDQLVYDDIRQLLVDGIVPAKLRAALYEVLARIPGVYLSSGQATLDGHTGVGISLLDSSGLYIQQVIIDPNTGLMIGTRDLDVKPTGAVPAGVSQDWTSITTTVVDSAPTGPFTKELNPDDPPVADQ